jgi:hypothetical protein
MDNIIKSIENLVEEFSNAISEEYDIDIEELKELWIKISKKPKKIEKSKTKKEDEEKSKTKKEDEEKPKSKTKKGDEDRQCHYVYTRKPREGERCKVQVKSEGNYCSTHKKCENKIPKEKSVIPKVLKTEKESPKKESPKKEVIRKPTFRLNNDIKKHVHPETNLVLKSATDKKIIGKLVDKKIVDLTEDDIEVCKKYGFAIDEEQLKKLQNDEEEENIVEKYLIKDSWSQEENITGKINKQKLESLIKKKVVKGDYDEEYENDGYPITFDIDKKNKKIIVKYTDGKGKENNINITTNTDGNLSKLFDYIKELKSDGSDGSDNEKKTDKKQTDNLSKKSSKKDEDEEDIEDIEDILDEVEENEEDEEELLEDDEEELLEDD